MTRDDAKKKILARRARFVAIAVASAGIPAGMQACGGNVESENTAISDAGAEACLSPDLDAADDHPQPCLGALPDSGPEACLQPPLDAAPEACLGALPDACLQPPLDSGPEVCLEPPDDAAFEDAPQVCLDIDPDAGTDA